MSMSQLPYATLPDPPGGASAADVLIRIVDALGFRFRWATEGLRPEDAEFTPGAECWTTSKLLQHILVLTGLVEHTLGGDPPELPPREQEVEKLRAAILERIGSIRHRLTQTTPEELMTRQILFPRDGKLYPVWNMINGPLVDAFTHVGQLNSWRRLNGNPVAKANLFLGQPPQA
jgi:hypothetical protein